MSQAKTKHGRTDKEIERQRYGAEVVFGVVHSIVVSPLMSIALPFNVAL